MVKDLLYEDLSMYIINMIKNMFLWVSFFLFIINVIMEIKEVMMGMVCWMDINVLRVSVLFLMKGSFFLERKICILRIKLRK